MLEVDEELVVSDGQILIDGQLYKIEIIVEAERVNGPLGTYTGDLARSFYETYTATASEMTTLQQPDAVFQPTPWAEVPEADREVMIAFTAQLVNRFGAPTEVIAALELDQVKEA